MKAIYDVDDYGLDQISTGNVIGFLMEAYEKGYIDSVFLDGLDLKWGDVPSTIQMIGKIARREGVGDLASKGVRKLAAKIGKDSRNSPLKSKVMSWLAGMFMFQPAERSVTLPPIGERVT
ncbi:MAG TPA: aldehyde ferredoxin oxidoreductase C-terminal domain-containing protein [Candidatus Saccharicenans sp.]|nr:aldehyde ferredoxin oxidoreductase C-terminal domain-containing protein [Candidatus Saccharicenans sp.]